MATRKLKKALKDMTTPELMKESARLLKTATKDMKKIEQQVSKLAALLGVHVRLV